MKEFMDFAERLIAAFVPMRRGTRGTALCFSGVLMLFAAAMWAPGIRDHPELRAQILGPTGSIVLVIGIGAARRVLSKENSGPPPAGPL